MTWDNAMNMLKIRIHPQPGSASVSGRTTPGGRPGEPRRSIALGFFDGVHLGHSRLLRRAADAASEKGLLSTVFTFDTHPTNEITGHPLLLLNTVSDRAYIMQKYFGIGEVIFSHFDISMMHMPWRDFINDILSARFNAKHLCGGVDYHFGYKGEGNPELLAAECARLGIGCDIIPAVVLNGIPSALPTFASSSHRAIWNAAAVFLGHPHILSGMVGHGKRLGRTLGIPTVNMKIPAEVQETRQGVYATRVIADGGKTVYAGVTNIGVRPTVTDTNEIVVETHIIDFDGDLYGKLVRLEFLRFLRPETKFHGVEAMKAQIEKDIVRAKDVFNDFSL